ncbi:MAG: NAD(P)H-dependent oxidoreductase [Pyrinomonadaceae bacterium]
MDQLYIPIILGTTRQGRMSEHVARFVLSEVAKREGVETELIDVRDLHLPTDDAGEQIKDPKFSAQCQRADALIIVAPEYNRGYPGMLKHALDSNLKEYIHKAVGICGVSAGLYGGSRMVENMLPVMRELGLVTIFWDVNFGNVHKAFDEAGNLIDQAYVRRVDKFLKELLWMAKTLRHGRLHIAE